MYQYAKVPREIIQDYLSVKKITNCHNKAKKEGRKI